MKKCPFCAEDIQQEAVVCKHCGRDLKGGAAQVQLVQPKKKSLLQQPLSCAGCLGVSALLFLGWCSYNMSRISTPTAATRPGQAQPATATPAEDAAVKDIDVTASCRSGGFGAVAMWDITLKNNSKTTTYQDIRYRSMYASESGNRLRTNRGAFEIVLKPGEKRRIPDFNDGPMPQQTTGCGLVVIGATPR